MFSSQLNGAKGHQPYNLYIQCFLTSRRLLALTLSLSFTRISIKCLLAQDYCTTPAFLCGLSSSPFSLFKVRFHNSMGFSACSFPMHWMCRTRSSTNPAASCWEICLPVPSLRTVDERWRTKLVREKYTVVWPFLCMPPVAKMNSVMNRTSEMAINTFCQHGTALLDWSTSRLRSVSLAPNYRSISKRSLPYT